MRGTCWGFLTGRVMVFVGPAGALFFGCILMGFVV